MKQDYSSTSQDSNNKRDDSTSRNRVIFILMLSFLSALTPFSMDMYLPSLPSIGLELGASIENVQYTVSVFLFGLACGQLIHGPLSDTVGRIRVLTIGLLVYMVATILCSMVHSLSWLIILRFVQALGCGAVPVLIPVIVNDLYPGRATAKVMSKMMMVMTVAPLLAPIVGGYLVVHNGWRWLFYALFGLGFLSMMVVVFYLKESHTNIRAAAWRHIGEAWRGYIHVATNPMAFANVMCASFAFAGLFSYITGAAFLYIEYHAVATEHFGYYFGFNVLFLLLGNYFNSRFLSTFEPAQLMFRAVHVMALSGLVFVVVTITEWGGVWSVTFVSSVFLGSLGFIAPNASAMTLNLFPKLAGTASSVMNVCRFTCGAAGGYFVSLLHTGTPVPLSIIMCVVGAGALLSCYLRPDQVIKSGSNQVA